MHLRNLILAFCSIAILLSVIGLPQAYATDTFVQIKNESGCDIDVSIYRSGILAWSNTHVIADGATHSNVVPCAKGPVTMLSIDGTIVNMPAPGDCVSVTTMCGVMNLCRSTALSPYFDLVLKP